ncbi:ADP-ribosylation/crystallin J1 [Mesorhizobium sp. CN2-181]|uniref:ADP-ribosylation/crystallin J1 n=1 Tax=Mesorhizobium yinganensis TaxID=3157707 RepID=UPI0032B84D61
MTSLTRYRPVGANELKLIADSGWTAFPPRLPEQPIFYPVTNEAYASQIAHDWNTRFGSKEGFVTRFEVDAAYAGKFDRKIVGGREHEDLWVPAEELEEFNRHIVGRIEVTQRFSANDHVPDDLAVE